MESICQEDHYQYFTRTALVPMTLRVAVAGHRNHNGFSLQNAELRERIEDVYHLIHTQLMACHRHPYARHLYAETEPTLRIVSSLADGADRLLVESNLVGKAFQLSCILPFNVSEYANDFTHESKLEYYELLKLAGYQTKQSRVLELDGKRENADMAYKVCGESLIKNCDLLVALYDGQSREGFGTAFTVTQAIKAKIPVIWIDSEHPNKVAFIQARNDRQLHTPLTESGLNEWLGHVLLFDSILNQTDPETSAPLSNKVFAKFTQYSSEKLTIDQSSTPSIDFNQNSPLKIDKSRFNPLLHGFTLLKSLLISEDKMNKELHKLDSQLPNEANISESVNHLCERFQSRTSHLYYAAYIRADLLASHYSSLHRSIFVYIYILAASALIIAALAIALADKNVYSTLPTICAVAEMCILGLIYWLYRKDHQRSFHDKWLEYRCIAEFLRPTLFLSYFGTNYPMRRFRDSEETVGRNLLGHGGPERCWAYLYTETIVRWVGFSGHCVDRSYIEQAIDFSRGQWLSQQYRYHTQNAIAMKLLGHRLARVSEYMFWATSVVIGIKIITGLAGLSSYLLSTLLGLLATWLPVLGTTAFAIRNHAEFEISAQRSLSSREVLLIYNKRLQELKNSHASMSEIDDLLMELTADSIKETADWLEIYEVKDTEAA